MKITAQTTVAELEQWTHDVRTWPCKPTSVSIKFFGASRSWEVTICMPGGPVIGHGKNLIAAIEDVTRKASSNELSTT